MSEKFVNPKLTYSIMSEDYVVKFSGEQAKEDSEKYLTWLPQSVGAFNIAGVDEVGRGCELPDAEVLTKRGWLHYQDMVDGDLVFSYRSNGSVGWERAEKVLEFDFKGELVNLKNKSIDISVTPDHHFVALKRVSKRPTGGKEVVVGYRAEYINVLDLKDNDYIPRGGIWEGHSEDVTIPSVLRNNTSLPYEKYKEVTIDLKIWSAFLGIYLAEGCTHFSTSGDYVVNVCQTTYSKHYGSIKNLLDKLPFNFRECSTGFICNNKQLYEYLKPLGNVYNKRVPKHIKESSPEYLNEFLKWAVYGDGTEENRKGRKSFFRYYTSSEKLKDDFEEILLKAGWTYSTVIKSVKGDYHYLNGYKVEATCNNYCITFRRSLKCQVKFLNKSRAKYDGKVFCLKVPSTNNFCVRRKGRSYFTGNSLFGDVVAACVLLPKGHGIKGITDSKKLSEKKRASLEEEITSIAIYGIGSATSEEVDKFNIFKATHMAVLRAYTECAEKADIDLLLCDGGLDIRQHLNIPSRSIVKGDFWSEHIGAASIVAKVYRDNQMDFYHDLWPEYGLKSHKGYGTKMHREAIEKYGMTPFHRRSFGLCKTAKERNS